MNSSEVRVGSTGTIKTEGPYLGRRVRVQAIEVLNPESPNEVYVCTVHCSSGETLVVAAQELELAVGD